MTASVVGVSLLAHEAKTKLVTTNGNNKGIDCLRSLDSLRDMKEVFGKRSVTSREFPVLLWDAFGTLCHLNPAWDRYLFERLRNEGKPKALDQIEDAWIRVIERLNRRVETSENLNWSLASSWTELLTELDVGQSVTEMAKVWSEEYLGSSRMVFSQDMIELCEDLRDRGYQLGVVSNHDERLSELFRLFGILDLFDVIISGTPQKKPAAMPFHLALEDLEVDPNDAIYIGESFAIDVVGAQRAGLKAVLYDPSHREMRALAESTAEALSKVVSIEVAKQNHRLHGVKVVTQLKDLAAFFS